MDMHVCECVCVCACGYDLVPKGTQMGGQIFDCQ